MMVSILPTLALLGGLVFGAIAGFDVGLGHGRKKERLQVIAFLLCEYRAEENVEAIAKRIDSQEHHQYIVREKR